MKERRIFFIAFCAIILIGVMIALSFRMSIPSFEITNETLEDLPFCGYNLDEFTNSVPPSVQQLSEDSVLIVQVKPTGNRELCKGENDAETLTEVVIESVMKSTNNIKQGDTIYVHEPVYIGYTRIHVDVRLRSINNIMQEEKSYLLCLQYFSRPEGYKYSEKDLHTFFYTSELYGAYPMQTSLACISNLENFEKTYGETKQYDCVANNKTYYDNFMKLRKELFESLKISLA